MLPPKNIIVIGGNAAGPAAAAKAKRTAPDSNVILFEAGDFISTGTCELPYVLSEEIKNYQDIVFFIPATFEIEKGVKVFVNHLVEKIDRSKKILTIRDLKSNQTFDQIYDKLILATGSKPKTLPALHANLKNVFVLKSVANLLAIRRYLDNEKVRNILILGAGYIGLEAAESFRKLGYAVTIVEKEILPMPGIEDEVRHLILDILQNNNVEFIGNVKNHRFKIEDDKVITVYIEGRELSFDLILQAIGVEPNVNLAVSSRLQIGKFGGIKVDQKLRTSDPNIFAAGDSIEVINKITGLPDYFPLATIAHSTGHVAGGNAAGGNAVVQPFIKNIALKIFDRYLVSVGLNSLQTKETRFNYATVNAIAPNLVKVMPNSENVFGKIIYEKSTKKILGAVFFGGSEVAGYSDLISSFIQNKIKAIELANINYNYTPPLSPFVNLLLILGRKIEKEKLWQT